MTDQAGVVIDDSQQNGGDPLPLRGGNLEGSMMKIEMPETEGIISLIATYLKALQSLCSL
jgi:hypothetical protein